MNFERRFWSLVRKGSSCWQWLGSRTYHGYGRITRDGKRPRANRVAWELTNGAIPKGMGVLHRCDNRLCVNPDHLFLGTQADNVADMMAKGRRANRNSFKGLSVTEVRALKQLLANGAKRRREIAKQFSCTPRTVERIARGEMWAQV